ncbi:MAG: hypothetical protein M3Y41_18835 [Pseudomonadota bacterium]|nr:hypothetical protein [Pseudomonadota bacterium]
MGAEMPHEEGTYRVPGRVLVPRSPREQVLEPVGPVQTDRLPYTGGAGRSIFILRRNIIITGGLRTSSRCEGSSRPQPLQRETVTPRQV